MPDPTPGSVPPADGTAVEGGRVVVHLWAAARAAAGTGRVELDVAGPLTLAEVTARTVRACHPDAGAPAAHLTRVLAVCSALVGDRPVGGAEREHVLVVPGSTVELLPPFAGG